MSTVTTLASLSNTVFFFVVCKIDVDEKKTDVGEAAHQHIEHALWGGGVGY
jgi:hypothetical protein